MATTEYVGRFLATMAIIIGAVIFLVAAWYFKTVAWRLIYRLLKLMRLDNQLGLQNPDDQR